MAKQIIRHIYWYIGMQILVMNNAIIRMLKFDRNIQSHKLFTTLLLIHNPYFSDQEQGVGLPSQWNPPLIRARGHQQSCHLRHHHVGPRRESRRLNYRSEERRVLLGSPHRRWHPSKLFDFKTTYTLSWNLQRNDAETTTTTTATPAISADQNARRPIDIGLSRPLRQRSDFVEANESAGRQQKDRCSSVDRHRYSSW